MKLKFNIYIIFIFLIPKVLLSDIELHKYGKLTGITHIPVIFDSKDFEIGDEINIKITGKFIDNYIYYYFFDDFNKLESLSQYEIETLDYESSNKEESHNDGTQTRYYTILKLNIVLNDSNGKYLAIYAYMDGAYNIENTKENEANLLTAIIVIIVVLIVVAVIIGVIIYCIRKRQAAMRQANQNIPVTAQIVNVQSNYIPNNNVYNNGQAYNNIDYNNNQGYNNNLDYNNNVGYNNNQGYNNNIDFNNNQGNNNNVGYNSANVNSNTYSSSKLKVNPYNNNFIQ